ncbi:alpha/beta hydrolase domain-containing protein [Ruoffia tabacinasalis]
MSFLEGYYVERIYLTGQSQSDMYLNTYVYFLPKYITDICEGFRM